MPEQDLTYEELEVREDLAREFAIADGADWDTIPLSHCLHYRAIAQIAVDAGWWPRAFATPAPPTENP